MTGKRMRRTLYCVQTIGWLRQVTRPPPPIDHGRKGMRETDKKKMKAKIGKERWEKREGEGKKTPSLGHSFCFGLSTSFSIRWKKILSLS